eukprot:scaffold36296_cov115-Cyclotella_meneghiniana.AAC.12
MPPLRQSVVISTLTLLITSAATSSPSYNHRQRLSTPHRSLVDSPLSQNSITKDYRRFKHSSENNPIRNAALWGIVSNGVRRRRVLGEVARRSLTRVRGGELDDSAAAVDTTADGQVGSTDEGPKEKINIITGNDKKSNITSNSSKKKKLDSDDERYSRQMYALGARAHGLVRSTTAILDGPLGKIKTGKRSSPTVSRGEHGFQSLHQNDDESETTFYNHIPSGLLYETAKNLALSGVGRIILIRNEESFDAGYFDGSLDDLGAAYFRAALSEVFPSLKQSRDAIDGKYEDIVEVEDEDYSDDPQIDHDDGTVLLMEYIQRLNPGVQVDIIPRQKLFELLREENAQDEGNWDDDEEDIITLGSNPVMVCIDRSTSAMLEMNDACRLRCRKHAQAVPFVSMKTAGVYSQIFCDFGPSFVVVDEDGETPRSTLIDKIESKDDNNEFLTIHCLDGERHDVSSGDVIEFQGEGSPDGSGSNEAFPQCRVVAVKSPTCFTVKELNEEGVSLTSTTLLARTIRSFTRVKIPKTMSFFSLRDILQTESVPTDKDDDVSAGTKSSNCWDKDSLFAPSDLDKSFDPLRRKAIMASMAALDAFVQKYGRLPCHLVKANNDNGSTKSKRSDKVRFQSLINKITDAESTKSMDKIISQFANTCRAKFTPIQCIIGAVGAQEILKSATGLYNPVKQFLLYDCDEVLESSNVDKEEQVDLYDENDLTAKGQSYILGKETSQKLASSRIFLVGAGAIGCELLKNLASMGAGTYQNASKEGCLIITDMDTIEKSNLSRQLLFRDHNVGDFKSAAAKSAVLRFLSNCNLEAHTSRVGEEEDGPFDDDFWSSGCDFVLNALDNVEARLFVDSQCVSNGRGLIDAGTLGPKGNVQVIVPYQSESYGSSADPPEPDIPVCTLKNFPYDINHTIQWARDLFDGYFQRRPRQANDHVKEIAAEDLTDFAQKLVNKFGQDAALDMAEELGEDIGVFPFAVGLDSNDPEYLAAVKRESLNWARNEAEKLFFTAINELLQKHPADSIDEEGAPFWTGSRRVPTPLSFKALNSSEDEVSAQQIIVNERIAQFVQAAARLRVESFLTSDDDQSSLSAISLEEALSSLEEHAQSSNQSSKADSEGSKVDNDIHAKLNRVKTGASFLPNLNIVDFEKDDETNGHVSFVTAASNLRAMAYGIPIADAMETRRVAGRIVPAMITTTGLVSALSCLELIKMLKGLPLTTHRNAFVNLALPFFAFTAPLLAEEIANIGGRSFTMWDKIAINASSKMIPDDITLREFIDNIKRSAKLGDNMEVSNISFGSYMIYANFLNSEDVKLLESSLMNTVKSAVIAEEESDETQLDVGSNDSNQTEQTSNLTDEQKTILSKLSKKRYIDFSVAVEHTETGEEYELPPIRYVKQKKD